MKSTPAIKNIRMYKNKIDGKPKRVTTGVDDYGNRFHVVKGKVKSGNTLREKKKLLRNQVNKANVDMNMKYTISPSDVKKIVRAKNHNATARKTTGKEKLLHKVKAKIHTNGMAFNSLGDDKIRSRQALVRISKRIRKK
jgi:hypothetical protein